MKAVRDSLALTLILGFATLVSFVNQLAIARAFGAGPSMDLYLQAVAIPLFAMATFSGLFAFAMVPVLTRARAQAQGASVLAGHFLRAFAVMSLTVGMLGWLLAPLQLRMLGVGRLAPESVNTAIVIARFAWGAVALSLVTGFLASVGNAARRFSVPGFATLLPILGVLIACVGWAGTFGVQVLAVGLLAGYACAALALFAALRNEIVWPPAKSAVGEVSAFFGKVPLALIAVFSLSIYPAIDAFWAPRLGAANLSYLGYCQRLLVAAGTIMIAGPATVLQTRLSEAAHQERHADLLRDLATALRTTIAIAAPVGILVSVLRVPIIQLIFERGAFDSTATQRVAALLPWMLPGMVAMLCVVMLFKALFARGDLRAGVVLGVLGPAMYFALSGWLSGLFGVRGIGAAYSITWITIATVGVDSLYRTRERGWRVLHRSTVVFAGKLSGAIAVSGAVTGFATHLLFHEAGSLNTVGLALRIAAASAFGASTYLAIAVYVWRIPELSAVLRALKIDFN